MFQQLKLLNTIIKIFFGNDYRKKDFKSNKNFWIPKIERNIARDREVTKHLRKNGWKVIRIWESELSKDKRIKTIQKIIAKT